MTTGSMAAAASGSRRFVQGIVASSLVVMCSGPTSAQVGLSRPALTPTDAAILLVAAAYEPMGTAANLQMKLETDWLGVAEWQKAKELSARLAERPFTVVIAEVDPAIPRRRIVATAEIWLATHGGLLNFRLGPEVLVGSLEKDSLRARVEARNDWTEPELRRVLVEEGALLPPGEPSEAKRRAERFLAKIEKLTGRATVDEIEFSPLPPREQSKPIWERRPASAGKVNLEWLIRATAPAADLSLRIDAIAGHVTAVSAHSTR